MTKSKKTSTTTRTLPTWLTEGSQQAVDISRKIADRPYLAYQGERIAGMSPNEREAYMAARYGPAQAYQDLETSRAYAEQAAMPFTEFDMEAYMNPYIKGALDPAAREIREEMAREQRELGARAGEISAFGGARQAILESEAKRGGLEAISDLYGRGYAQAFESARDQVNRDRAATRAAADQFRMAGGLGMDILTQEIQNLLTTGGLERNLKQAGLDFDYMQFMEARDWDVMNLQPLLATLSSVPHGETQTNVSKARKSTLGMIASVGSMVAGGITMGMTGGMMGSGAVQQGAAGLDAPIPGATSLIAGGGGTGAPLGPYGGTTPGYAPALSNQYGGIGAMTWGPSGIGWAGPGWNYAGGVY